jgi:hypothetical protein
MLQKEGAGIMKKSTRIWLITAVSLILTGAIIFSGVMTVLKWDFTRLTTGKHETSRYDITEEFKNISVITETADVVFALSSDGNTHVECFERSNMKHSVSVIDGTLTVKITDTRKWYEYLSISFRSPKITVYLPKKEYGAFLVNSSTGNVSLSSLSIEKLDVSVSTGNITASELAVTGDVSITVSTGNTTFKGVTCNSLASEGSTGNITLTDTVAKSLFSLSRSTGNVIFEGADANEIIVETSTGNVKGTLKTEKIFLTSTDTGKVTVPETLSGGRCKITTSTGNIKISVE